MALYPNTEVKFGTQFLIGMLKQLNKFTNGLTDAQIAAITSSGTVAKLQAKIAALNLRTQDKNVANYVVANIDRCVRFGTLTDADVETARAAGTFAALITAIQAHTQAAATDSTNQAYSIWAQ